ncbi:MAG: translation initiation factor IF-2 [Chlorobi bacterium]|nr:MAG: translation initiation factor 2 [Chlorobi bacterium OLB6]MBE2265178.1 translation initiation factor IF-2 [Flavobacteriales bacterium]MBL1160181.1 translation initiation factor IF-2 [Chlorobiota bacterium]MBW7853319.1 translation initiation factor IF-2 [Candidatus Kapabacteria bacterium]MCC6332215.1 translation initiation factor IF-2 [Ignavibacteria bacterium]
MAPSGNKLFKVAAQINISKDAIVDYLVSKGFEIQNKPTAILTDEMFDLVVDKFAKELKVAEKQRAKVQRQQAVRKTLLEGGGTVSIDALSETEQHLPQPAAPAESRGIAEQTDHAVHHPAEDTVTQKVSKSQTEADLQPEPGPQAPAEIADPQEGYEAKDNNDTTPVADVETEDQLVPAKTKKAKGPAVGEVIDLDSIGKAPAPAEPEPAAEAVTDEQPAQQTGTTSETAAVPETQVSEPKQPDEGTPETLKQDAETAAPADAAPTSEPDEKRKRKRKGVIEVDYKPGTAPKLRGLTVLGKIDVQKKEERPKRTKEEARAAREKTGPGSGRGGKKQQSDGQRQHTPGSQQRQRPQNTQGSNFVIQPASPPAGSSSKPGGRQDDRKKKGRGTKEQFSEGDVARAIRQTLSGMEDRSTSVGRSRIKQKKRAVREEREAIRQEEAARESTILQLSEFVTTGDLANLMRVTAADIIMKCMGLGLMVSINQRLDKETIELIASDYGFTVEFLDDQAEVEVVEDADAPEDLKPRSPIVTIMGHVDHGKTSLLDYIRHANVVAGEAGGITQHIGAYRVNVAGGRHITFLDTPGHEAFTAMRARGAQVTDIVVLVVAADDSVMPQTIEAISHAQAANVPMVIAINKIDKPDANPEKIKQQLADHNVLVEEWGGKYQSVALSARSGLNVDTLLEKILLEADLLDLKANPDRAARATVIEAHVDKGRGNVVTVIVQKGTLSVGDIFVCGQFAGRVRAMTDERGNKVDDATPSMPVQVTGFDGLPNAGDVLMEMETDSEAREVASRRQQLRREQQFRGMRHMTLDDISAQIQQGGVKELRLVVKADVSGSLEALSDSLLKLSTPEVKVRILYRSVGAVTESDVMLAAASDAVIVGFQVTVSGSIRKLAEAENVDVRLYSIIYDCINEIQLALEGLLTPDIKEEITATVEVRQLFKISKLGTIAGCYVQNGTINRNDRVRVLRDGFEIFKGTLASLRRVKEDVREVVTGYECGINIQGFNDLTEGDIIEAYKTVEIKRKLT